jgi:hypothetical protein
MRANNIEASYWQHFSFLFYLVQQPPNGPEPPHSRAFQITYDDAPQSVGLIWTSDQLVAEITTTGNIKRVY